MYGAPAGSCGPFVFAGRCGETTFFYVARLLTGRDMRRVGQRGFTQTPGPTHRENWARSVNAVGNALGFRAG